MKVPNIRFNLKGVDADGHEVVIRTLDDLRTNLNLSDLWDYFKQGELQRWLLYLGEREKAGKVRELTDKRSPRKETLQALCQLLDLEVDDGMIRDFVSVEERLESKRKKIAEVAEANARSADYLACLQRIVDNKADFRVMREVVGELLGKHRQRFQQDARNFRDILLLCLAVAEKVGEVEGRLMGLPVDIMYVDTMDIIKINGICIDLGNLRYVGSPYLIRLKVSDTTELSVFHGQVKSALVGFSAISKGGLEQWSLVMDERQ